MQTTLIVANCNITQDNEGRYCLNDLHHAAGGEQRHQPRYYLASQQTKELIAELQGDSGIPLSVIKGGRLQGTYVCKELVYAYAMWISPKFHLQVIRAYDAMATGRADDVEEMFRKEGARKAEARENELIVLQRELLQMYREREVLLRPQPKPIRNAPTELTADEIAQITLKLAQGLSQAQIARELGRSAGTVSKYVLMIRGR